MSLPFVLDPEKHDQKSRVITYKSLMLDEHALGNELFNLQLVFNYLPWRDRMVDVKDRYIENKDLLYDNFWGSLVGNMDRSDQNYRLFDRLYNGKYIS